MVAMRSRYDRAVPVFTRAAPLIAWMHDEYLSELILRGCAPKPAVVAPSGRTRRRDVDEVTMEWGLVLPDQPTVLATYQVRAEGVSAWTIEGTWDRQGELQVVAVTDDAAGLVLALRAPGAITLRAARVSIESGPRRRYTPPPRPDRQSLLIWGPRAVTWEELWGWLAPAADAGLFRQRPSGNTPVVADERRRPIVAPYLDTFRVQARADDAEPMLFVAWHLAVTMTGHYLSVTRSLADAAMWSRALRLPAHLAPCQVRSGSVLTTGDAWLTDWVPRL